LTPEEAEIAHGYGRFMVGGRFATAAGALHDSLQSGVLGAGLQSGGFSVRSVCLRHSYQSKYGSAHEVERDPRVAGPRCRHDPPERLDPGRGRGPSEPDPSILPASGNVAYWTVIRS
jgi:hypothetical protein